MLGRNPASRQRAGPTFPGAGGCAVCVSRIRCRECSLIYSQCFGETGCTSGALRDLADMPKTTFYRALFDLLKDGQLVNIGTKRRPFYTGPGND